MQELKKDLKKHMDQDREDFQSINVKLDDIESKVDQMLGQWKLVGAIVGVLTGIVVSIWIG